MNKYFYTITILFFYFITQHADAVTWEKLYTKSGADCFRDVHELSGGDFIASGYTNSQNSNDTDGLVVRFNSNGDRLWTFVYNGSSNDEDGFYKGVPTADGGFILCGFSSGSSDKDEALFVKLNSAGVTQWVKTWGDTGIERAKDIIELPNGKFIAVGVTSSSPAQNFDTFILKLDANGNKVWSKTYGSVNYDEANSVELLPDGGFLMGGVGDEDFYIIRTDADGDDIWSKYLGTSGVDVIKCLLIAQGGNGFVLSGTTTGVGAGLEDAYLIMTDTGGVQQWAKYYGGPLNDGFQAINKTSDGGYIGIGTSRLGPWPNPNVWLFKLNASGNLSWQTYFGGQEHDHGYSAAETSDGGFIVGGHSRSFSPGNPPPDAFLIKTDANGNVQNPLTYTTVTNLISPVSAACGNPNAQIVVEVANYSDHTVSGIPVTIEITGAITQTLTQTYSSPVVRNDVKTFTFTTTVNMSAAGTYNFHCFTGNPHDVYPDRNYSNKTIVINTTIAALPVVTNGTHCGPGAVSLSASSSNTVRWYNDTIGGVLLYTGLTYSIPYLTSDTTYFVRAGTTCPSAFVPVTADITSGLPPPSAPDAYRCDSGSVLLTASSSYPVAWYDSANSIVPVFTGYNFNTPSIDSIQQYFVAAENSSCSSIRISVNAMIHPVPVEPVTSDGSEFLRWKDCF